MERDAGGGRETGNLFGVALVWTPDPSGCTRGRLAG